MSSNALDASVSTPILSPSVRAALSFPIIELLAIAGDDGPASGIWAQSASPGIRAFICASSSAILRRRDSLELHKARQMLWKTTWVPRNSLHLFVAFWKRLIGTLDLQLLARGTVRPVAITLDFVSHVSRSISMTFKLRPEYHTHTAFPFPAVRTGQGDPLSFSRRGRERRHLD